MSDLTEKLISEAKRIEEDSEHSAKGHFNAADRWGKYHLLIGLPSAILAAVAGAAAFKNSAELAGALAILSTALTTILTFLKPSERSETHKSVAGQYLALRNTARIFREIELSDTASENDSKKRLFAMAAQRDDLNQSSPSIARKDYELAKKDIDEGRSIYKADKEG
ncbi:MAG: hypothetical protein PWP34_2199 [Desulfuromonadales bacterium]|jgi:hypothetical protein|nr:hypothetical protein [Desulfuromonadales bacterium]